MGAIVVDSAAHPCAARLERNLLGLDALRLLCDAMRENTTIAALKYVGGCFKEVIDFPYIYIVSYCNSPLNLSIMSPLVMGIAIFSSSFGAGFPTKEMQQACQVLNGLVDRNVVSMHAVSKMVSQIVPCC